MNDEKEGNDKFRFRFARYRGIVTPAVILALCLAPCLAFGFYAADRKNYPAQIFLAGFTICHFLYGIANFL